MTKSHRVEAEEDEDSPDLSNFNPDVLTNTNKITCAKFDYSLAPDEDFLTNYTLWPEANKLYGHGYEVYCLAVSHDGNFIASGAKAQSEKHAKLFLWKDNKLVAKLDGHALTIVQIEFSKDDEFILSVSRDRSVCLFRKDNSSYRLVQCEKETHARIIWGASWSEDSRLFVTGSRDMSIKFWARTEDEEQLFTETLKVEFKNAVTSVCILPSNVESYALVAVGIENGDIFFLCYNRGDKTSRIVYSMPACLTHGSTVKRIKAVPTSEKQIIRMATCSDDYSVRIFEVNVDNIIRN